MGRNLARERLARRRTETQRYRETKRHRGTQSNLWHECWLEHERLLQVVVDISSPMSELFSQWCLDLSAWIRAHHGAVPRRKSEDAEERRLANWVSKTLPRKVIFDVFVMHAFRTYMHASR